MLPSLRTCCSERRLVPPSTSKRSPTTRTCLQVLAKVGLIDDLVEAGKQVAETMVEMFADLPPDHEFFEQFSFISASDLPEFVAILGRSVAAGLRRSPGPIVRNSSRCPSS